MKVLVFLLSMIFLISTSCAQESETIPDVVQKAFKSKYPDVKDVEWEKEGPDYEAEFEKDGVQMSVVFDKNGKIVEVETEDGEHKNEENDSTKAEIENDDEGEEEDD
ncbi:MAG: hypothetical protein D8M58_10555 [Calditrichaeota bacterium]|nr:MAG: hypothetical protein DWQ03_09930 [Calditrichota bacterium]MBL1205831.1 hypothetical protein [Calditrichota bacterium]NOG45658.1 hypothetical protein [Calditrichota bacterium]